MPEPDFDSMYQPNGEKTPDRSWTSMSRFAGLGIELPAAILIGVLLGQWVGSRVGYRDAGMLIGLGFGLAVVVRRLVQIWTILRKDTK